MVERDQGVTAEKILNELRRKIYDARIGYEQLHELHKIGIKPKPQNTVDVIAMLRGWEELTYKEENYSKRHSL